MQMIKDKSLEDLIKKDNKAHKIANQKHYVVKNELKPSTKQSHSKISIKSSNKINSTSSYERLKEFPKEETRSNLSRNVLKEVYRYQPQQLIDSTMSSYPQSHSMHQK